MPVLDLAELTAGYRSVYHDFTSWEDLLAELLADPIESVTVLALAEELRQKGSFRRPVALGVFEEWDLGDEEVDDVLLASYPAVQDGTHRVCAHLLTGVAAVTVEYLAAGAYPSSQVMGPTADEDDPLYWLCVETYLDVPLPLADSFPAAVVEAADKDADPREIELDLWETLVSLRIDDDNWITSATSGSRQEEGVLRYSISWDSDALYLDYAVINARVLEKLASFGYETSRFTIRTVLETYEGDDVVEVDPAVVLPAVA